jgi:hypothetical protein
MVGPPLPQPGRRDGLLIIVVSAAFSSDSSHIYALTETDIQYLLDSIVPME